MAISTNSIIHYTKTYKALTSILREGFKVKYCKEIIHWGKKTSKAAHPMVSFCDIPLSDSTQHFAAYGKYGIGLSKSWAIDNGVNPVIYIDKGSLLASSIRDLMLDVNDAGANLSDKQKENILQIKSHAKNYSGPLKRKNFNKNDYRFYDEREWRLVPDEKTLAGALFSVRLSEFEKKERDYNKRLDSIRVKFSPMDISYIIVRSTSQIPVITNFLRSNYSSSCTADELDILLSKICSTEQIVDDY